MLIVPKHKKYTHGAHSDAVLLNDYIVDTLTTLTSGPCDYGLRGHPLLRNPLNVILTGRGLHVGYTSAVHFITIRNIDDGNRSRN